MLGVTGGDELDGRYVKPWLGQKESQGDFGRDQSLEADDEPSEQPVDMVCLGHQRASSCAGYEMSIRG